MADAGWHLPGLFAFACILGFLTCMGIGANDLANSFGTAYGSKVLTMKQLVVIAFVAEMGGATLMGATVSKTVKDGVVNTKKFEKNVSRFMWGMIVALISTAGWLALATWKKLPVSTTHSIIGAVMGFGLVEYGFVDGVVWAKDKSEFPYVSGVVPVFISWFASPLIAGTLSVLMYVFLRLTLLRRDPRALPILFAAIFAFIVYVTMFVNAYFILIKGMKARVKWSKGQSAWVSSLIALPFAIIAFAVVIWLIKRMAPGTTAQPQAQPEGEKKGLAKKYTMELYNEQVESGLFRYLQVFTCICVAFAHGANDVANGVGPVGAVYSVSKDGGKIKSNSDVPIWILAGGGFAIGVGLALFGRNILEVVGNEIVQLTPSRGFAAEFATAGTVMIASVSGMPVSTTQIITGAVIGIGLVDDWKNAVEWKLCVKIFGGWVLTILITVVTSALLYLPVHYLVSAPKGHEVTPLAFLLPILLIVPIICAVAYFMCCRQKQEVKEVAEVTEREVEKQPEVVPYTPAYNPAPYNPNPAPTVVNDTSDFVDL